MLRACAGVLAVLATLTLAGCFGGAAPTTSAGSYDYPAVIAHHTLAHAYDDSRHIDHDRPRQRRPQHRYPLCRRVNWRVSG